MSDIQTIYVTDREDDGTLLGRLVGVTDDRLYRIELAPHLVVIAEDGERYEPAVIAGSSQP